MKKTIYCGFAVLLMLAVVGIAAAEDDASAADIAPVYACPGQGPNFADANGDSVCDNLVDENGDGINDNCGGYGAGYGGNGPRDGTGYRNGGAGAGVGAGAGASAGGCYGGGCGGQNNQKLNQ